MFKELLVYTTQEETRKSYLEDYLARSSATISEMNDDEPDKMIAKTNQMIRDLHNLMQASYDHEQYLIPRDEYVDVSRVIRVRLQKSRKEIEKLDLGATLYYVYGMGLYAVMEGIILSPTTRQLLNYDNCHRKGRSYNINYIPEDVRDTHDFRLAVPCYGGLFVPKKSAVTDLLRGTFDLSFFEVERSAY